MHEASLYRASSFVTLTYDDDHLESLSLRYRDFQIFCRRARRKFGPFRFFMAGEYGERQWRPHFHAALFGVHFSDRYPWRKSPAGFQLYRSPALEEVWTNGSSEIGDVSLESAGYIARYCVKKVSGDAAKEHYSRVDFRTGEIVELVPEFSQMSRKPGIGSRWFDRFASDVFPHDRVIVKGQKLRPPRYYYQKFLESGSDAAIDEVEFRRFDMAMAAEAASQPSLESQELVAKAALRQRGRKL